LVYLNTFKNNSVWHGYDLFHNKWDNGSVGNFWDDYIGNDIDKDGIGNSPYNITGGVSQDNYPMMNPDI
jgi:nitrous oxidase accessory protein NosD